jgi:hypothetical protein
MVVLVKVKRALKSEGLGYVVAAQRNSRLIPHPPGVAETAYGLNQTILASLVRVASDFHHRPSRTLETSVDPKRRTEMD